MPRTLLPIATFILLGPSAILAADRPWEGQYKIQPHERQRLTPADVVGPDGVVYPNWTQTGVQVAVPATMPSVRVEDFGARADDDRDDSAALDQACAAAGRQGGGAVLLGPGTYHLDWPVTVRDDGVVIRGQGAQKTKILFRYAIPPGGVGFYDLTSGSRVGPGTQVTLHCRPKDLMKMTILVDDRPIHRWERSLHSGNTFACAARLGRLRDGPHRLQGIAEYKDGSTLRGEIRVVFEAAHREARRVPDWRAALLFQGAGPVGKHLKLARDARRGDCTIQLESTDGLAPGDCLWLDAPATDRWKRLTRCACLWGRYRQYATRVESIEGRRVTLAQPLRIEFPTIDGSYVRKIVPRRRCGVEDFSLEQTEDLWISGVLFSHGWNCWARGVTVKRCGRFPVYGSSAKWCTIRDCTFDDAWFKGGGGTAYAGWDGCWDCLMDNVTTYKLRHAPLFQWAASGNVIRRSTFHESDAQWHAGWTNENLIEQCAVTSVRGNGGYGFGMWASPPEDKAHGPNGPRNVVYNCDVRSSRDGLWMGGMNERWLVLYNRFVVDRGCGVFAKTASFDHLIRGNVFVLRDPKSPMVRLAGDDCPGVEIIDNQLFGGSGQFAAGLTPPERMAGNRHFPAAEPPRPAPLVPSIYEWQLLHAKR